MDNVLHLRWALRCWRSTLLNLRGSLLLQCRGTLVHRRSWRHGRRRPILLHGRRTLLHGRQVPWHWVRLLAMRGLRWMIAVGDVALLFSAAHILDMSLLFQTTLLLKSSGLRRGPAIRVPRGRGRTTVPVVIHTSSSVFGGLLLVRLTLLFRPVAHPLWRRRRRTTIVLPVHLGRHAHLRRVTHAGFRTAVTWMLMMRRVMRLMLGVRRLGGGHAAFMHADVVPRAVGAVQH